MVPDCYNSSGKSQTVLIRLSCQYAAVEERAQEGERCSLHIFKHSLKIISTSCTYGPFLFPYHKHPSEFIWLNVWWMQMLRLCCLPWVPNLAYVQEYACTCPIQGELEHPVIYLNNYNQSHTAQIMNVWSSELISNPEKKHPRSNFIELT